MKKLTAKEKLNQANETIDRMFFQTLHLITGKRAFTLILSGMNEDLYDLDRDIENEQDFLKETHGKERGHLNNLKKVRKEQAKLIAAREKFIKQRNSFLELMDKVL